MPELTIAGQTVPAGEKRALRIPVTTDLNGHEIALWVHVVAGARPGPTLTLTAAQHGDEWQTSLFAREVVMALDPAELTGNVIVLPVCSPPALGQLSRLTQMDSDGPDLNRVFPGVNTWVPEQLAATINREILPHTQYLIDCHFGIWGTAIGIVAYGDDIDNPALVAQNRAMALAWGYPFVQRGKLYGGFPGPRSLLGVAGWQWGIAGIAVEVGVAGYGPAVEARYLALNLAGLRNVLAEVGSLGSGAKPTSRTYVFERSIRLSATKGGFLVPVHDPDEPGRRVEAGEVLGRVIDAATFETLETIIAPAAGHLHIAARNYPVHPGDWAFSVAPEPAAGAEWVGGESG